MVRANFLRIGISRGRVPPGDVGVSLVEVAVAMIVLGVLLVAFLPLVVSSIELAVKNTAVARANQILSSEIDRERNAMASSGCTPTSGLEPISIASTEFTAQREVTCDDDLATLSISVTSVEYSEVLANATTKVLTG